MLPLGYVAVPFLIGSFSAGGGVDRHGFVLLTALYLGFMGRLVLKDFRDQYGDALYGKRTMLVRCGRARTCRVQRRVLDGRARSSRWACPATH